MKIIMQYDLYFWTYDTRHAALDMGHGDSTQVIIIMRVLYTLFRLPLLSFFFPLFFRPRNENKECIYMHTIRRLN